MSVIRIQGEEERRNLIYYEFNPSEPPLGVGGMGKVYRGVRCDKRTGTKRDVAIKFLYDDVPDSVIERARREASIRLKNDSLVEMLGFIEIDRQDSSGRIKPCYHVVSEFVDGVALDNLMEGKITNHYGHSIPFAEELLTIYRESRALFALRVVKELLTGLMSLHDAGYVHRDIDPSNIMVTADGHIKLIDFGIVKKINSNSSFDKHLTSAGQFMGKACYAAPELVLGDVAHQDSTTDIYAVGIMLFEMIAGHLPFDGPINEVLQKQIHDPLPIKDIPQKAIRKVIEKATEKKQSKRYSSAVEFRVDIDNLFKAEIQNYKLIKERLRAEAEAKKQKDELAAKKLEEERQKLELAARKAEQERARQEQLAREKQELAARKAEQERVRQEQLAREKQELAARKAEQERVRQEQLAREKQELAARKAEQERARQEQLAREKQKLAEKKIAREQAKVQKANVKNYNREKLYKYVIPSICGCLVLAALFIFVNRKEPVPNPNSSPDSGPISTTVSTYSINQVKEMLLDPSEASRGWKELERLVASGDYESVFFQSRIYFKSNESKDIQNVETEKIRHNLGLSVDNEIAHSLLVKAVSINSNDYKSLFELGCDFKSGQRGTPRDIEKAKQYLKQAQELAQSDPEYLARIEERLKGLGK